MNEIYIPPRYRVRFNGAFKAGEPVQVEVHLLPTGVFGVQDGRTLRRNEDGQQVQFDQKTGDFTVRESTSDEALSLDPVSLDNFSIAIGPLVSVAGNCLFWTITSTPTAVATETAAGIATQIGRLTAVLPMLGYLRQAPISISTILLKQDGNDVGWAELVAVNLMIRPYKRDIVEEEFRMFDSWLRNHCVDTTVWWAMVYLGRAMRHQSESPFLDDRYAEIIINLWKGAEAILGTWKIKEVESAASRLGLSDDIAAELKRLCQLRHSDDVAHAVIYRKKSPEQFHALYVEQEEKIRRAVNVLRTVIENALNRKA